MAQELDAIVVGLGGMGSAAAYHLARRGAEVLGLDRNPPGHANGSSHGRSRIHRDALAREDYLPLVKRARVLWQELEAASGRELLRPNGLLSIAARNNDNIAGSVRMADAYDIRYELLAPAEVHTRFPAFALDDDLVALYEPDAGTLRPEECVAAHLELAGKEGATLRHGEAVHAWHSDGDGVRVDTDLDTYSARHLVLATGPWAAELLGSTGLPFTVQRIVNAHFLPDRPDAFSPDVCPNFALNVAEGSYYGCPDDSGYGVKIGWDHRREVCTPETIRREVEPAEIDELRRVLDRYLPGAAGELKQTLTCMYTDTPDRNFIVDRLPGNPDVVVAGGCSGHAFKFTSVIGELAADLTLAGRTEQRIGHLSAARFG